MYTGALGLSVERRFGSHGLTFAFLDGGDVRIEVVAGGVVLAGRGVRLIGGPVDVPEIGQRIAFIADNLGTVIELTEPSRA